MAWKHEWSDSNESSTPPYELFFHDTNECIEQLVPQRGNIAVVGPGLSPAEDPTLLKICQWVYPRGRVYIIDAKSSEEQPRYNEERGPYLGFGDAASHVRAISLLSEEGVQVVIPKHIEGSGIYKMTPDNMHFRVIYDHGTLMFIDQASRVNTHIVQSEIVERTVFEAYESLEPGGLYILQTQEGGELSFGQQVIGAMARAGFSLYIGRIQSDYVSVPMSMHPFAPRQSYSDRDIVLMNHIARSTTCVKSAHGVIAYFQHAAYQSRIVYVGAKGASE